jgi:DNA-directed RNA polymerase specialized sigma24 family protein
VFAICKSFGLLAEADDLFSELLLHRLERPHRAGQHTRQALIDVLRKRGWSTRKDRGPHQRGYGERQSELNPDALNLADQKLAMDLFYNERSPADILDTEKLFSWLKGDDRVVAVLSSIFGFTNHEIGMVLGVSPSAVSFRFRSIRKSVKRRRKKP